MSEKQQGTGSAEKSADVADASTVHSYDEVTEEEDKKPVRKAPPVPPSAPPLPLSEHTEEEVKIGFWLRILPKYDFFFRRSLLNKLPHLQSNSQFQLRNRGDLVIKEAPIATRKLLHQKQRQHQKWYVKNIEPS